MNFVIPSFDVLVVIGLGELQLKVGLNGGAELAFIVMSKIEDVEPSVSVKVAVPELEKVTAKGVLIFEVVILAPVKAQETIVEGEILVEF